MAQPPFDVARAHKWFAVELNNFAWELAEAADRSPDDDDRMIHSAHGACFHWLEVGNIVDHLRAQCLLATAYAKSGLPEAAIRHARKCLALSREAADQQTAFDRATAHGCASAAYAIAGQLAEARAEHELATAAAAGLDDPSETAVFERLYPAP